MGLGVLAHLLASPGQVAERDVHDARVQVKVSPLQPAQLTAPRPRDGRKPQIQRELVELLAAGSRDDRGHGLRSGRTLWDRIEWICRTVRADIGRHWCGRQPARSQSWPGLARRTARAGTSPAPVETTGRRPWTTVMRPSAASAASACWSAATGIPSRAASSRTDGSRSPGRSSPLRIASLIVPAACCLGGRLLAASIVRTGK
jgi:hypothetical protein